MLVGAVLLTTLLDFKDLLKYLLEIQGSLMFEKLKEAYKILEIGSEVGLDCIRLDQT